MDVVEYEYRVVGGDNPSSADRCELTCVKDELKWSCIIKLPYPFGHDFWDYGGRCTAVVSKSKRLARDNGAPDWAVS